MRSVFGLHLNRFTPDLPGQITTYDLSIDIVATITGSVLPLLGKIIGQYGAEGDLRKTKVPTPAVSCACCNAFSTKYTGGQHQLFLPYK